MKVDDAEHLSKELPPVFTRILSMRVQLKAGATCALESKVFAKLAD